MMYSQPINNDNLNQALALRDLTDPAQGEHCMQLIVDQLSASLGQLWEIPMLLHRGPRVVSVSDNYDRLRYPQDAITRAERYSRYVDDHRLLRTHTTALVPRLLRQLSNCPPDDQLLVIPGPVWRRDVIDRTHVGEPHQLDLWRICTRQMSVRDLEEMIHAAASVLAPGAEVRISRTSHPYTLEGREIEILVGDHWLEIGECGLGHPEVLAQAGLPDHSGLAMGIGLERAVMLRKGVDDIRLLRSADPRVSRQMLDLRPYRPVSHQPPARRDISIAMRPDITEEEIAERVRERMGADHDLIEELSVISRTPAEELSRAAQERIGIRSDQENILLRIIIRHPVRSVPKTEANKLKDMLYLELHEGSAYQLST